VPRPSFAQLPEERRRRILDVAAEEFARSGFEATSYNKLLERLGLGKSSAYHYFDNKRDLFVSVVIDCYARYFAGIVTRPMPTTTHEFWAFVGQASVDGFDFIVRDPQASAVMRCMQRDPSLLAELATDQMLGSVASFYESTVVLGQRLGAVRADLPTELLVHSASALAMSFDQWFVQTAQREGTPPDSRLAAARFVDLVRRMLEPA
jgi:AcrR family transcriptional regulator